MPNLLECKPVNHFLIFKTVSELTKKQNFYKNQTRFKFSNLCGFKRKITFDHNTGINYCIV